MHARRPDPLARLAIERVVNGDHDGSIAGDELQHELEHDVPNLVHRPAGLAEEPVIATEGLATQAVTGQKNVRDRSTPLTQQPAGGDDTERLKRRFRETGRKLLNQCGHGRWKSHEPGLLPKCSWKSLSLPRKSAGGPFFHQAIVDRRTVEKCKTLD